MLTDDRDAAINRSLGNVDGARRKTNGAAHRAVADREGIARSDDIAVDGGIVQVEALTCPVQVTLTPDGLASLSVASTLPAVSVPANDAVGSAMTASAMSANRMVMRPHALRRWVDGN